MEHYFICPAMTSLSGYLEEAAFSISVVLMKLEIKVIPILILTGCLSLYWKLRQEFESRFRLEFFSRNLLYHFLHESFPPSYTELDIAQVRIALNIL